MIRMSAFVSFALMVLAASFTAASAVKPNINSAVIGTFLKVSKDESYFTRSAFEKDLFAALKKNANLGKAVTTLAPKYKLPIPLMDRFARLWIQWVLHRENEWPENGSWGVNQQVYAANYVEMRNAFTKLVRDADHLPFVVEHAATAVVGRYDDECQPGDFNALTAGAKNMRATVWTVASHTGSCERWRIAALSQYPHDAAFMWNTLDQPSEYTSYTRHYQRLALLHAIENAAAVRRLPPDAALALRLAIARRYVVGLWDSGLVEDALAYFEKLPVDIRKHLLEERQPSVSVIVDGLPIDLSLDAERLKPGRSVFPDDFRVSLAAALYVVGRAADALALYRTFPHPEKAAKAEVCDLKPGGALGACQQTYANDSELVMIGLDLALVRPLEDPYDIAELQFGQMEHESRNSGLWLRFYRKRLDEPAYRRLLPELAARWYLDNEDYKKSGVAEALDAGSTAELKQRAEGYREKIRALRVKLGLAADFTMARRDRGPRMSAIAQSAYRFPEEALPPKCAKSNALSLAKPAKLPEGFALVRAESDGKVAAAISLSQNLDPAGEVSAGGYWVHLSLDGGRTWDKTLYTGLAQYFPYSVRESSCQKMLAGDHLDVEVEIAELDRRSITYPPVGLMTKRRASGKYLQIPITALERDSDRDLITDIEEEHLLLDPQKADSDGDGLHDGVDPLPNVANALKSSESDMAMAAVAGEIFGGSFGALIEAVDKVTKPLEQQLSMPRGRDAASPHRPIFIEGNAQDYAGLRPPAMMLVYSEEQVRRLETMTPVFHAVKLWPLVMSRDRSRGFVKWSARWVGGTLRVTRKGRGWKTERISGWIT